MSKSQDASSHLPQPQSSLSFTQGFLLGQLSIAILIGAFIKFFVFGEIPSPESSASSRTLARRLRSQHHVRSTSLLSTSPQKGKSPRSTSYGLRSASFLDASTILSKTYYNVNSHQPESLDWFNVLIAQTIAQFRQDANEDEAILTSLTNLLNGPQKPDFLSSVKVTEISLGEEYPILSNCRVHPVGDSSADDGPQLQARMDVDLNDVISLGIDTKLILNYPRPNTAVLPVALAVSIVRFSGTLSISFLPSSTSAHPTPTNTPSHPQPPATTPTSLAFSFLPDYRLEVSVRSLVGSRSRLQDIPKIAQLVESRLHQWIDERCVEPRVQHVALPSFWPRKRNTREPSSTGEAAEGEGSIRDGGAGRRTGSFGANARRMSEVRQSRDGVEQDRDVFEEGLRKRKKDYEMPGSMPGMMVN